MGSRICVVLAVLIVLSSLTASAAVKAGAPGVYPGAKLQFEMTLTDKDFLPAIKQFLPAIPGMIAKTVQTGAPKESQDLEAASAEYAKDLVDALSGLHKVSIVGYTVKSADSDKVLQFYARTIGLSSGWLQPLRVNDPKGTFRLYVKPDLEEMFGLFVDSKQFVVVRTVGTIDVTKLARVAAMLIPTVMNADKSRTEQAPPMTVEPPAPQACPEPETP